MEVVWHQHKLVEMRQFLVSVRKRGLEEESRKMLVTKEGLTIVCVGGDEKGSRLTLRAAAEAGILLHAGARLNAVLFSQ